MTTLEAGITHLPRLRKRSVTAFAAAALAVIGFVVVSLALKSLAHLVLSSLALFEDSYGQCAEYILITALSMYIVRKGLDAAGLRHHGKFVFTLFLAISVLVMAIALSSGIMKVDFWISLLQMAALCLFAYLQFWTHDGPGGRGETT
jgi:hypothetical protein